MSLDFIGLDSNQNKKVFRVAGATLGQGVPLGAWCSFEKDVAPSNNWLMAGTTFDETMYPALNLYLGTNKVPSRYDHNRPSDYESITLSTDSNNPTVMDYDGEINSIIPYQHSDSLTVNGVVIADTSSHAGQTFTVLFKKGDEIYARAGSGATYKVRYYKHPLFIKATSIASDSDKDSILAQIQEYNTYSTEETLTGKTWIDGKKIYRRVVVFKDIPVYADIHAMPALTDYATIKIKKYEYYAHLTNGQLDGNFYSRRDEGGAQKTGLMYAENTGIFYVILYTAISELDIIIEYTKTTD